MPNPIVTAISQNKKTFDECRIFLYYKLENSKEKVIQLENSSEASCIPYYISYLESKDINIQTAMAFFTWDFPDADYWSLLKLTIVNTFRKLENNDLNFNPF